MYLSKHNTPQGPRWAVNGTFLPLRFCLGLALELPVHVLHQTLQNLATGATATGPLLAPVDADHEIWASGVTYLRSREARVAESQGDRAVVEASLESGGVVTATCRGVFVAVREGHPAYHRW